MKANTMHRTSVVAAFEDRRDAQAAIQELRAHGFQESAIGMATRGTQTVETAANVSEEDKDVLVGAATGMAAGAGVGALWGIGAVAGILPAIGPVIVGGALAAILASTAIGASAAGVAGTLIGLGVAQSEAEHYEAEFNAGRTVVVVKALDSQSDEAMTILDRNGGSCRCD